MTEQTLTFDLNKLNLDDLSIGNLRAAYAQGLTPLKLVEHIIGKMQQDSQQDSHQVWIYPLDAQWLRAYAQDITNQNPADLPLYGIPFAIKDNIDLAGVPTTAACAEFAYIPCESATVVQKLLAAGAIPLGKTNLDQFATGLNGTRSPYGVARNSINPDYIAGGSSSGSALAVALNLASFALGTDTAGSGRVPAAFNQLVGLKPTCGLLSNKGVVPACRSLDSVSIFANNAKDCQQVLAIAQGFDALDPYSKAITLPAPVGLKTIGVPRYEQLKFFGDNEYAGLFNRTIERLTEQGYAVVEVDFSPFLQAAQLLYAGPWVAERYHVVQDLMQQRPDSLLPVIQQIIAKATQYSAVDCFAAFYQLAAYKRQADQIMASVDLMLTPTTGTIYRIEDVLANPVELNNQLGYYTNFMNLLDFSAIAIPAGQRSDGLPFGITLFGEAAKDLTLLSLAQQLEQVLQ